MEGPEDPGDVILRIPNAHLVFLGLIVNRGFALIAVGFGLLHELNAFETLWRFLGLEQRVSAWAEAGALTVVLQVIFLLVAMAVIFVVFSILWSLTRFSGYTLRAVGDDLRVSCGLFTRLVASLPRHRIQAVTIWATWFHRIFGFASVAVQTAGGGSDEDETALLRRRFVPILRADDVPRVLAAILPGRELEDLAWQPISPTAARRMRRRALIVLGMATLPAAWFWPPALIPAAFLAGLAWWHAGASARRARYARTDWGLVWERGVITRRTTLLPDDKLQTVRVTESPFDRRHGHRTLTTDAAGGRPAGPEVQIRYLNAEQAEPLREALASAAATTSYVVRRRAAGSSGDRPQELQARSDSGRAFEADGSSAGAG